MTVSYAALQQTNPLATPDWRYQRARALLHNHRRTNRFDDQWTRDLKSFLARQHPEAPRSLEQLYFRAPALWTAYHLHRNAIRQPHLTVFLEARLLAGQPLDQIGGADGGPAGMSVAAVQAYERCWFAVTDRLHQHDWVMNQVIIPTHQRIYERRDEFGAITPYVGVARPFVDAGIKLLAYRGGPFVCEYLICGLESREGVPDTPRKAHEFIVKHAVGTITRRCAIAAEEVMLHADNIVEMFGAFTRILELQQRADQGQVGEDKLHEHLAAITHNVPWFVGHRDPKAQTLAESRVAQYDTGAVELRAEQLQLLARGEDIDLRDLANVQPEARTLGLRIDEVRDRLAGAALATLTPPAQGGAPGGDHH